MLNDKSKKEFYDFVNEYQRIQKQMGESPVMQEYNAQKMEKSQTLNKIQNGELKNRVQELSGIRPLFKFDDEIIPGQFNPEEFLPANELSVNVSEEVNNIVSELSESKNNEATAAWDEQVEKRKEFHETILKNREKIKNPEFRIAPLSTPETNFTVSSPSFRNFNFAQHNGSEFLKHLLKTEYRRTNEPVPVDFIQSIKDRAEQKRKNLKKIQLREAKEKKRLERKEYWKNFNLKTYLTEKSNKILGFIGNIAKKVFDKIEDWRFMMSLNKSQRALFRGWKKSKTSKELIGLALKKNINLNDIKNMNSRIDAVPE